MPASVCVRPTRETAAESKLHRGMKASGNFNIKREMSKKLFNSSAAAGRGFFWERKDGDMNDPAHRHTNTNSSLSPEVGVDNYTN